MVLCCPFHLRVYLVVEEVAAPACFLLAARSTAAVGTSQVDKTGVG